MSRGKRPSDEEIVQICLKLPRDLATLIKTKTIPDMQKRERLTQNEALCILLREAAAARQTQQSGLPIKETGIQVVRSWKPEIPHIPLNRIVKDFSVFHGAHLPFDLLRPAIDASRLMIWVSDAAGKNIYASPMLEHNTGCSAVRFRQDGWICLIHPEDQRQTVETCRENFERRTAFRFSYRLWFADGYWAYIVDYAQPRFDPDGRYAGFIGTMHEVPVERAPNQDGLPS